MPSVELIHGAIKASKLRGLLEGASQIVIVSGFVTSKGLVQVSKPILDCVRRGGKATLFLGLDRVGIASPQLIRDLGALLRKARGGLQVALLVETGRSFLHAKIFAARKPANAELLVGSFNLTGGGLTSNHEVAAHVTGSVGNLFGELSEFIASIDGKQLLTLENYEALADALVVPVAAPMDPEVAKHRRDEAQARQTRILAVLKSPANKLIADDEVARWTDALARAGSFWTYDVDLEKLSIPSGLSAIYDQGLLVKEKTERAGTARMKVPSAFSATYQLVPAELQRKFTSLGKSLGKALGAYGFETPYGYWVPDVYREPLRERVARLAIGLSSGEELEAAVRKHVALHRLRLPRTTRDIITRAAEHGLQHPSRWKNTRDPAIAELKVRAERIHPTAWRGSVEEDEALKIVGARLLAVRPKLDAGLAVSKLRRIRPEIFPVPIDVTPDVMLRLLESMVWAVAEGGALRNTRPAMRRLSSRIPIETGRMEKLSAISEALIEGHEQAAKMFFTAFGAPPYWQPEHGRVAAEDDDDDDDDVDDDRE